MSRTPRFPGTRITTNGNQLVAYHTEARLTDGGVFYPITPSTEMGEAYQLAYAEGKLNVHGQPRIAIETEGEHAAQGGAIALSTTGRRVVNFTSGQGLVYGLEQYYHAPGKLSTLVVEVSARALTRHALNVHCGHDDVYAALDTGWIMLMAKDAQQAADQALILRRVTELSLTPGMNIQDGFLTSHLERTFLMCESDLIREFLGRADDIIDCPTPAQCELFGPTRRRVPAVIDLTNPTLIGPVQNQEHYMNGVIARRNNFAEPIIDFLRESYQAFGELTGRHYGLLTTYRTEDADVVFISIGSAAENIEAAVDHLRSTRGAKVGSIHVNSLRPFPEVEVVEALAGKKACIILERTDEPLSRDNPLALNVRAALSKACRHEGFPVRAGLPNIAHADMPRIFTGVYGLGSRDFRPEHVIGAYEYVTGKTKRQDGESPSSGFTTFVLGIDHPYAVVGDETPSLLPEGAIAVRLHSIGGWGMITTGKNLGEIIGHFGESIAERTGETDEYGRPKEVLHISANPKYGSEKKGAPTSYFLVVAPKRVRVNCDLKHINTVLCCDPKIFLHTNPLDGLSEGGAFVWESDESPETAWQRIPKRYRQDLLDKKIRVFILNGFRIAREATDRPELQLRMQGNAFLGAFFNVSPFLNEFSIEQSEFQDVVRKQYVKKFGRFGDAVIESNMTVMTRGFEETQEIVYGAVDDPDTSSMRGTPITPLTVSTNGEATTERAPLYQTEYFDREFRAGLGYDQPASPLSAIGLVSAATGATASKYVARRQTPVFDAAKCTQCMECIAVCPDTAMPNTAQDLNTLLETSIAYYVEDPAERETLHAARPAIETEIRAGMLETVNAKGDTSLAAIARPIIDAVDGVSAAAKDQLNTILDLVPMAFQKSHAIFRVAEKKNAGAGGIFSIFISDRCKGCGECVIACGSHEALVMEPDTEDLNTQYAGANAFLELLPETPERYLGLYDDEHPADSKTAALRNHLMLRHNYEALVSGDGACAGCGEKTILRGVTTITEAYMRPLFHAKAERLREKADRLEEIGANAINGISDTAAAERVRGAITHLLMGLGGEDDADTQSRLDTHGSIDDTTLVDAIVTVMRQDAFNHRDLQAVDGGLYNGMSVMAMGAHTGCNTVYGSTPPNNPHPYPWMNSLFQDGATISWLMGESFIVDHSRRSVVPERLADLLLEERGDSFSEDAFFDLLHMNDSMMTELEIAELPKVWTIGGDGGMGDIGFQNVSKVVLQNRPNVKMLMLDTQVYSNTGGQNSDSSPMPGGFDMNQYGAASEGKLTEKKSLAEIFTVGHGSPMVAQVSIANAAKFFRSLLDALQYRGTAFFQCFTTCQPEHGVGDDMALVQAQRIRDSRGMPEFVFQSSGGERYEEAIDLKGNPSVDRDWWQTRTKADRHPYEYTVAHWATTEARFRRHVKPVKSDADVAELMPLEDLILRITQDDVVNRRFLNSAHRSYVPDFGCYIRVEQDDQRVVTYTCSRQMVLFCVERRKAWRMLQSRAAIESLDYRTQQAMLQRVDSGDLDIVSFLDDTRGCFDRERAVIEGVSEPAGV